MIVEAHPDDSRTVEEFAGRFSATHRVDIVYPQSRNPAAHDLLKGLTPLDQSIALFERLESTVMLRATNLQRLQRDTTLFV